MRPSRSAMFAILALFPALSLVGCSPESSAPVPAASLAGLVEVDDEEGEQTGPVELPKDFPSDFPLPADYTLTESRFVPSDQFHHPNFFLRGTSSQSLAELTSYYRERLPQAGFKVLHAPAEGAPSSMFYFESDSFRDCSVQIRDDGDSRNVLINLPLRE